MSARQQGYPLQLTRTHLQRLIKVALLLAVSRPPWYGVATSLIERATGDYDQVIRSWSRGFPDQGLLPALRQQPSPALLATMVERLSTYDRSRIELRRRAGNRLSHGLGRAAGEFGWRGRERSHWLLAVTSADPDRLVAAGRAAGFDLTTGSSTLVAIDPTCAAASAAMREVVYLPVDPVMPEAKAAELTALVAAMSTVTAERVNHSA